MESSDLRSLSVKTSFHQAGITKSEAATPDPLTLANGPQVAPPPFTAVHHWFEATAEQLPGKTAVLHQTHQTSYADLNKRANQLAHYLQKQGIAPNSIVGLCLNRSTDQMVGLLGILKAGGAYLPLDPAYPTERLALMLEDAQVNIIVTQTDLVETLPQKNNSFVCLDRDWPLIATENETNPGSSLTSNDLAYVIYTSGSTGRPKGVMIPHRALINFTQAAIALYNVAEPDRVLHFANLNFDAAGEEIYPTLMQGATLCLRTDDMLNSMADFLAQCTAYQISMLSLTTAFWHQLVSSLQQDGLTLPDSLRLLTMGGEKANGQKAADWYRLVGARVQLFNGYGPTEATVIATVHELSAADLPHLASRGLSIGRPLPNCQAFVLDAQQQLVPVGEPGELVLGGPQVALGYLHQPDLTAVSFISHPFSSDPEAKLYRTGDQVRWQPDGNLEFLGRIDEQVKIRGFRIEPGEIEALLARETAVREAVVLARNDTRGELQLIAYIVPTADKAATPASLRAALQAELPAYMIPAAFVLLDEIPLTPNGKVDKQALPTEFDLTEEREIVPPRTAVETSLVQIWQELLALPQLSIHDNFFELGGHSLMAMQLISRLRDAFDVSLNIRTLFEQPTIAQLAASLDQQARPYSPIPATPRAETGPTLKPASFSQQRLWFLDQLKPGQTAFNMPLALRLDGRLNVPTLQQSLNQLIACHESLRTTFTAAEGVPMQVIQPTATLPLHQIDLTHLPADEREAEAQRQIQAATHQPFDLAQGPLLQITLFYLAETSHFLLVSAHHIITDGWSEGVMLRELSELYQATVENRSASLPEPTIQYADFSEWQHQWLHSDEAAEQLAYWEKQLTNLPPPPALPTDFPRPTETSGDGALLRFTLPPDLTQAVKRLGQAAGATPYMTLLAALKLLLYRYTGQEDVVVGTSIANRTHTDVESVIGFFLNTLVLRTDLSGSPTFHELLSRVREVTLNAFAHQRLPVDKVIERLPLSREASLASPFQTLFIYQNMPYTNLNWPGLTIKELPLNADSAMFDLTLTVNELDDKLECAFEYSRDLFEAATIERLFSQLQVLLTHIVANPAQAIDQLPLLGHAEQDHLLTLANGPQLPPPPFTAVHHQFEAIAKDVPGETAVLHQTQTITYAELNQRANQLAHHLQKQGVGPNSIVGLCLNRSIDLIVGLLGILKAGGAYLPLDPAYPTDRLALMLEDAQVKTVVTQRAMVNLLPQGQRQFVCLDVDWPAIAAENTENLAVTPQPEQLAYVIYTSGSTGRPKGVMIPHRALSHFTQAAIHLYDWTATDRMLQFATINFDAAVEEIFPTLVLGATLCLRTDEMLNSMDAFVQQCAAYRVTMLDLPTAFWHQLVGSMQADGLSLLESLRLLIIGGEKASGPKVADWHRLVGGRVRLFNTYGPTEATVVATAYELPADGLPQLASQGMSIGRALAHGQAFVLDARQQPVPLGVPGELVLGGPQVALGYLHQPELTAVSFIPHPFSSDPEARLYRTGDRVRWLPDGNLEFWGRVDEQVKIRGFRIEPGEIEARLLRETAVRDAVVLAREDARGEMQLIAYVVPAADDVTPASLRAALQAELPAYMIPAAFVLLGEIPLTPNGKVNKHALPDVTESGQEREIVLPRTAVETTLAHIWQTLLGIPQLGIHDSFFELGGHSLMAMQLISRIRDAFGVSLPIRTLFEQPTVAQLAQAIASHHQPEAERLRPFSRPTHLPLSFAQQRIWILDQIELGNPATNITAIYRLHGSLNVAALNQSLTQLVSRHEILRTTFVMLDGEPVQQISPPFAWDLPLIDLSHLPPAEQETAVAHQIETARSCQFDLAQGPLFLTRLLYLNANDHVLILVTDHIVSDGWSMSRIAEELSALYTALVQNQTPNLPQLPVQYADYALWQRQWLSSETAVQQTAYWQEKLSGAPPALELPTDRPRPARQSYNGAIEEARVDEAVTAVLQQLSGQTGATLFMTLLAAFKLLLSRYTGETDIVVGTPTAGRSQPETENLLGMFLNNLTLRTDLGGSPTFRDLLSRVRQTALDAYVHQEIPFERLLEALHVERDLSRTPLFQVLFNMLNLADGNLCLPDIEVEDLFPVNQEASFDLTLYVQELESGLHLELVYNTDLFNADRMAHFLAQFCYLLEQIATQPDRQLSAYTLVTPQARPLLPDPTQPITETWASAVHHLVSQQAQNRPHHLALQDAAGRWTYADLECRSNQLAHALRAAGVQNQEIVAIYAQRSAALVWAMLGILKAGAAFLLLDAAYPPARLRAYLETAKPRGWIALETAVPLPPELDEWLMQADLACKMTLPREVTAVPPTLSQQPTTPPAIPVGPDDLAYVLFTSGTSGTPKGILGRHSPLAHFFPWQAQTFSLTADDRFSMLSGLAHDPLLRDIFTPLIVGATLFIPAQETLLQPGQLANWLAQHQITVAHLTPALGQVAAMTAPGQDAPALPTLRYAFFGGDRLTGRVVQLMRQMAPDVTCVNFYGATETPQAMAYHIVEPVIADAAVADRPIPLGHGIADVQLLVLNAGKQLAGISELGEIYIRTPYLTKGYLAAEDLTKARFVPNPFTKNGSDLWYRTGDLGRYLPDGRTEFAGRADRQVKVRGFRIELGEIEIALSRLPGVQQCAVVASADEAKSIRLVAYVVGPANPADLRASLATTLPDYMVPNSFVQLEQLPLTPNGKLDSARLPAPEATAAARQAGYVPPNDALENKLVDIWEAVLAVHPIGIHDNYFELGGHSLQTIALFTQIERAFNQTIPLAIIFQAPTIAELAAALRHKGQSSDWSPLVPISASGSKRPFYCVHGGAGHVYHYRGLARHLGPDQPFYGLQPRVLQSAPSHFSNLKRMAHDYVTEIRKLQPEGPYAIGGFCFGGIVAFEMAQQLTRMGQEVALVAIIDAFSPTYSSSTGSFTRIPTPALESSRWRRHVAEIKKQPGLINKLAYLNKSAMGRFLVMTQPITSRLANLEYLWYRLLIHWYGVIKRPLPLWLRNFQLLEVNRHAKKQYKPEIYPGELTIFRQVEETEEDIAPDMGWSKLTSSAIHVHTIPGGHLSLLQEPHVQQLAELLQASLDASSVNK